MRIHIWSSNGEIIIDETGAILDSITYLGGEFPAFTRFDTAEFIQCYGELEDSLDILDIGAWYLKDGVEEYIPADPDFRKQVRDYDTMNADGSVEKDDTHWNVMR